MNRLVRPVIPSGGVSCFKRKGYKTERVYNKFARWYTCFNWCHVGGITRRQHSPAAANNFIATLKSGNCLTPVLCRRPLRSPHLWDRAYNARVTEICHMS